MSSIAKVQAQKEQEIDQRHDDLSRQRGLIGSSESDAATTLQRAYRGHRTRRELKGLTLSPSARWTEAIKEAKYRDITAPRPSSNDAASPISPSPSSPKQQWRRVNDIVRRAGGEGKDDLPPNDLSPIEAQARPGLKDDRAPTSTRTMDLAYFLEMVDQHHRYGSHLRKYHALWQQLSTHENFFYWLDYGEGKDVSLESCSREKLDSMRVRYLGKEERGNYAVEVGPGGKLCWKRNGVRVDTGVGWRDSVKGIVRVGDPAPEPEVGGRFYVSSSESSIGSLSSVGGGRVSEEKGGAEARVKEMKSRTAQGLKTWLQDSKMKIMAHRPFKQQRDESTEEERRQRKKMKKRKWIFVADPSHNLYIGIKQSGAFQHSSFLHGGRVSAAGLIEVHDGQLRFLQPRSGHYKPPASNFQAFVHSLQDQGCDMSMFSLPRSYAVLIGMEGYARGMKAVGKIKEKVEKRGGKGE
ncbi:MAG: hypothetical protein LQ351_000669 [Letrouitia transgressa]|nr:MAG: hypothetical protein LQ351_000669 [Letrouitia transgressa]